MSSEMLATSPMDSTYAFIKGNAASELFLAGATILTMSPGFTLSVFMPEVGFSS